mgnify:CR=1 FL=1
MKVDILSREYPPKVYGGAGVHAEELSKVLAERVDVTVRAFDGPRAENEIPEIPGDNPKGSLKVVGYDVPKELQEANGALKTFGVDLQIADDVDATLSTRTRVCMLGRIPCQDAARNAAGHHRAFPRTVPPMEA